MTFRSDSTSIDIQRDAVVLSKLDDLVAGLLAFEQHDYESAIASLSEVNDSHPAKFAIAQERLGVTYLAVNNPAFAIEPLERALQIYERLDPVSLTVAECKMHLGIAYAQTGHHEMALSEYRHVVHRVPDWSVAYFQMARSHACRNRALECVEALLLAAQLDASAFERARTDADFAKVRESAEFQRRCCA